MTISIEVISKEMIKPCTPTPHHLHHYQFSFLDQTSPPVYISLIYFFNNDQNLSSNDMSKVLKLSLSEVLTLYYPLAGCVQDNHVDCNDDGVLFLEAKVSGQLSEIIDEPVLACELDKLLPYHHQQDDIRVVNNLALAIQVNFFDCGGVAVGARMSHKIADGSSFITFFKNWAATARGDSGNICPQFVAATLFPPIDVGENDKNIQAKEKNIVLKRFVFRGSVIAALREKYVDTTNLDKQIYPTRIEALSSFIWSRFTISTGMKFGLESPCMLVHAVNFRKRMDHDQPLHDDSFGNLYGTAITDVSGDIGEECYGLVNKLRDAISKINKEYAKKLQDSANELFGSMQMMPEKFNKGNLSSFIFSSLCRYPVYEVDFGWGRPIWVAWCGLPYKNLVILMDTKSGDGIEAWVHLEEEDMAKFETDKELLMFTNLTYD